MSPMRDLDQDSERFARALTLGHIRLGTFDGVHPVQSDTFLFTASRPERLEILAGDFGGKVIEYEPQGMGQERYRLITERDRIVAVLGAREMNRFVSQKYVRWGKGYLRVECEGYGFEATTYQPDTETGDVTLIGSPCLCEAAGLPPNRRECAYSSRVWVLLPQTGLGLWEVNTGSKKAATRLAATAQFLAAMSADRVDWLPVELTYLPEKGSYFDPSKHQRRATTKRILSMALAGDIDYALRLMGTDAPERAAIEAVQTALADVGRELVGGERPALSAADVAEPEDGRELGEEPFSPPAPAAPESEEEAGEAPPAPGADLPASTEAWERAGAAGLTGSKALAIAKGLKFDVKTATDITAGQLSTILGKHLDGAR